MNQFKTAIFLLLLLSSCKKDILVLNYGIPEDLEVQTLPVTLDKGEILLYSNLYSSVDYIQLEMTDQSLVGSINKLEITDTGDLIMLDGSSGSVKRFDEKGKYICTYGKKGKGYGEYVSAADIVYDKYNDCLIVLDQGGGKLLVYDMDGKYQSSIKLESSASAFTVLDKDYLCIYMNHFDNLSQHLVGHNLKVINREGVVMSEYMEFDTSKESFHPACNDVFFMMDSKMCIKQPFSSIVYSIDDVNRGRPSIVPELYIDFGDNSIPQEWYQGNSWDLIEKIENSEGITYVNSMNKVNDCLFLNLVKKKSIYLYVLNLRDRSLDKPYYGACNDMYGFVSSRMLVATKGNKCYYMFNPRDFDFYKETLDKEEKFYVYDKNFEAKEYSPSQKEKNFLLSIHDDDNPIIQVCTLKD